MGPGRTAQQWWQQGGHSEKRFSHSVLVLHALACYVHMYMLLCGHVAVISMSQHARRTCGWISAFVIVIIVLHGPQYVICAWYFGLWAVFVYCTPKVRLHRTHCPTFLVCCMPHRLNIIHPSSGLSLLNPSAHRSRQLRNSTPS